MMSNCESLLKEINSSIELLRGKGDVSPFESELQDVLKSARNRLLEIRLNVLGNFEVLASASEIEDEISLILPQGLQCLARKLANKLKPGEIEEVRSRDGGYAVSMTPLSLFDNETGVEELTWVEMSVRDLTPDCDCLTM